jgi:class 3 adenylate cyclase/tetratricopeptide (TPR) repeat protein
MWSAAMDVGGLLRSLGLDQYEADFRRNKIDVAVLPHLTADDLKDIGVSAVGDRRKLMAAIAILPRSAGEGDHAKHGGGGIAPLDPLPPPPAFGQSPSPAERGRMARDVAERRPLTVMFCDLVGSTALASQLDAEDWRSLVNAYLDEASGAVNRLGGHVLKRLGDGLMALFGYPQAQENDAERAVRAALAIQRALAELNARNAAKGAPPLSARIGLESGPVVVDAGDVFGEAPNIAARIQGAAEPGTVVVTAAVQRQTAGLFVTEDKGAHELKGVAAPVTIYRIVRPSSGRPASARTPTRLVGREEELDLLGRRWERARKGEGQLALVVGEPGIGKSRLIQEFRARLGETPHTFVEWSSSQLLQNTPLHPLAEWGRQRFGGAETPADQRLTDLESTLGLIGLHPAEYAPLIAPLLDVPLPEGRMAKLAPEELRRRQLAALTAWVLAGARSQAVALAFEDLHWADPTTLDLMSALAERGAQAPLFILATARPEFRPPWSLRPHHSVIALAPLDRAQVKRMVGEISSRQALSEEVVEGVSERTGGVPLFIEEVTRLLLERGEAGGLQAIPPTLQQSLAARLDRLGEARDVAQIGAVLGRDFSYALLSAVAGGVAAADDRAPGLVADRGPAALSEASYRGVAPAAAIADRGSVSGVNDPAPQSAIDERSLETTLERLAEADLLFVEGAPPNASYRFRHALIRDAAYDSLLKSRRQALHRRAAEALLSANSEPEAIAHHFTEAGLDDAAIKWWGRAGDKALRRSAFQEAIAHLGKAIAMADKAAGARPRRADAAASSSRRLKLQTDYGQAMMWSKGFAEETKTAFARAAELAARTGDFSERFAAGHGQWTLEIARGELRSARELSSTFLREAEDAGRVVEAGVARRGLAWIGYHSGDFLDAETHCEQALEACTPGNEEKARERFGEYTGALVMSCLAITTWQLGEVDRARELIETAIRRATELGHAPSMGSPLLYRSHLEVLRGDAAAALSSAEALESCAREHGMTLYRRWAALSAAWARGRLSDPAAATAEFRRELMACSEQGATINMAFFHALLAQLEMDTMPAETALKRIDDAVALAGQGDNRCYLSFIHRLRGEILMKRDPSNSAPAEQAFRTAIDVARRQSARSLGLQAALALAKLLRSTDRPAQAHAVLAPALAGFSATAEMPEIAEGQALLAALA